MKNLILLVVILLISLNGYSQNQKDLKESINTRLEQWHRAAAEANFKTYFDLMAPDAVFIGTDATENWKKEEFREWSRPYFDAGKAWSFSTLERTIFLDDDQDTAWFDELLDTQMGICRGSGVMKLQDGNWFVKHYVLSIAIPNEHVEEVTAIKKERDSLLIMQLKN